MSFEIDEYPKLDYTILWKRTRFKVMLSDDPENEEERDEYNPYLDGDDELNMPSTGQFLQQEEEEQEQVLVVMTKQEFVSRCTAHMTDSEDDLFDYIKHIHRTLSRNKITVIALGMNNHYRTLKSKETAKFKQQFNAMFVDDEEAPSTSGGQPQQRRRKKKNVSDSVIIGPDEVEEAEFHAKFQLKEIDQDAKLTFVHVNSSEELADFIFRYTKSIAESPFKKDRNQQGFSFFIMGEKRITVDPMTDEGGVTKLWEYQLQQFPQVTMETAKAISALFPTPLSLYTAIRNTDTETQIGLLSDVMIPRADGGSRRLGPALAKRICRFMASRQPNEYLDDKY